MNTEQLRTFLSLAQSRNFSLTAKSMIVAQSTISNRIQELEKEVGLKLFSRSHRGTELTSAGQALLEYAEKIISLQEQAIEQANRASQFSGRIILGTVYSYYDTELNHLIEGFMSQYPEVSIKVTFGHSSRILSESRKGTIDIGFSHYPDEHPDYFCRLIDKDDVILITSSQNTEYKDGIFVSEIKNLPFLSANFLYAKTHEWLFAKHQQFPLEMEIGANVISFIKRGNSYSLIARKLVSKELDSGELLEIPILDGDIPPVECFMIYRKDIISQYSIERWLDFFKQYSYKLKNIKP